MRLTLDRAVKERQDQQRQTGITYKIRAASVSVFTYSTRLRHDLTIELTLKPPLHCQYCKHHLQGAHRRANLAQSEPAPDQTNHQ